MGDARVRSMAPPMCAHSRHIDVVVHDGRRMPRASTSASASSAPSMVMRRHNGALRRRRDDAWRTRFDDARAHERAGRLVMTRMRAHARARSQVSGWDDDGSGFEDDWRAARRDDARASGEFFFVNDEDEDVDEDDDYDEGRGRRRQRRQRRQRRDGYEATTSVVGYALKALQSVSSALTRALDAALPSAVPMYIIQSLVVGFWGMFALLSATRLIYAVVVIGAVLLLAVALGGDNSTPRSRDGRSEKQPGMYDYATDSSSRGRRRREDFDERRRARARERKRRVEDFGEEDDGAFVDADFAFDPVAPFERGAEVLNETFANAKQNEAFRTALDVTEEVRAWGGETIDEFRKAFNLSLGDDDDDMDEVVAQVDFEPRRAASTKQRQRSLELVQIIDIDPTGGSPPSVSFDEWLETDESDGASERQNTATTAGDDNDDDLFANTYDAREPRESSRRRKSPKSKPFPGSTTTRTQTGASRNWFNEFISGQFYGAFQEDLIDVQFDESDVDEASKT